MPMARSGSKPWPLPNIFEHWFGRISLNARRKSARKRIRLLLRLSLDDDGAPGQSGPRFCEKPRHVSDRFEMVNSPMSSASADVVKGSNALLAQNENSRPKDFFRSEQELVIEPGR